MMQYGQQSTIAKPHVHVMLTQMSIKKVIKKLDNDVLLKELSQLHECDTLLLKKKEDMTNDKMKSA